MPYLTIRAVARGCAACADFSTDSSNSTKKSNTQKIHDFCIKKANIIRWFWLTPDISRKEQMIKLVVSYCWWNFFWTGIFKKLNINHSRDQGYDNGKMKEKNVSVQQIILNKNLLAFFVPCCDHSLNLFVNDAASPSGEFFGFLKLIQKTSTFFSGSTFWWDILKKIFIVKRFNVKTNQYDSLSHQNSQKESFEYFICFLWV